MTLAHAFPMQMCSGPQERPGDYPPISFTIQDYRGYTISLSDIPTRSTQKKERVVVRLCKVDVLRVMVLVGSGEENQVN